MFGGVRILRVALVEFHGMGDCDVISSYLTLTLIRLEVVEGYR